MVKKFVDLRQTIKKGLLAGCDARNVNVLYLLQLIEKTKPFKGAEYGCQVFRTAIVYKPVAGNSIHQNSNISTPHE